MEGLVLARATSKWALVIIISVEGLFDWVVSDTTPPSNDDDDISAVMYSFIAAIEASRTNAVKSAPL